MSDKELYVIELRKRIDTYFQIVIRNIRDQVPKIIGYFLVKESQDKIQYELCNRICSLPNILHTIGEAPRITEERNTLLKMRITLEDSLKVMRRNLESVGMDKDEEEIFYEIEKVRREENVPKKEEKKKEVIKEVPVEKIEKQSIIEPKKAEPVVEEPKVKEDKDMKDFVVVENTNRKSEESSKRESSSKQPEESKQDEKSSYSKDTSRKKDKKNNNLFG
jgi:hypothetical protein